MTESSRPTDASLREPAGRGAPEGLVDEELTALYEHAALGFALFDRDLRFLRINRWLADINGLPVAAHLGRRVEDLLPALAVQAQGALRHVLETGSALRNIEIMGETPAAPGVTRNWLEHWIPVRDRRGEIVAVAAVVEETTEMRRLARENLRVQGALAASEARHEFLVRLHDEMRAISDPPELMHRACRLLGEQLHLSRVGFGEFDRSDASAAVGSHFTDGVRHAEGRHDPSEFGAAFMDALRAGRTVVERDVRASASLDDGAKRAHLRWMTEAFVVVPVVEQTRLVALFFVNSRFPRDWTPAEVALVEAVAERAYDAVRRARALRRVQDSEQMLRLAKEASGVCVYDIDLVHGTCVWDEGLRALWGLAPEDPLSRESLRAQIPPEDLVRIDAASASAVAGAGDATFGVEHKLRRKSDGCERRVLLTGVVTFRDGVPVRNVGTVQDVTALREAERALREADRRKDEFLAMLAHELRNPLAPLRNALSYVERCEVPEHCHTPLRIATRQVMHMTRLVDDLLEVSRISRGIIRIRPERVLVQQTLFSVAEALSSTLEERRQRLEYELPGTSLWIDADPTRLAQVVENLLTNASKYSDADSTITLRAGRQADDVFVQVQDQGVGIDPDSLERVFELFTQVDSSIDRSRGGLGIGLALVKRLVEAQGGRVAATSEGRGRGATFTVWLPASHAVQRSAADA